MQVNHSAYPPQRPHPGRNSLRTAAVRIQAALNGPKQTPDKMDAMVTGLEALAQGYIGGAGDRNQGVDQLLRALGCPAEVSGARITTNCISAARTAGPQFAPLIEALANLLDQPPSATPADQFGQTHQAASAPRRPQPLVAPRAAADAAPAQNMPRYPAISHAAAPTEGSRSGRFMSHAELNTAQYFTPRPPAGVQNQRQSFPPVRLHIRATGGQDYHIRFVWDATIGDLKSTLQDMEGIPPDQQRIFYVRSMLDDDLTLSEAGIADGNILTLALRMRGD